MPALSLLDVAALALVAGVGVFLVVWSMAAAQPGDVELVTGRLRSYAGQQPLTVEELELRESIWERVFGPAARRSRKLLSSVTPASLITDMSRRLSLAGRPYGLSGTDFQSLRLVLGVLGFLLGLTAGVLIGQSLVAASLAALGVVVGYWGPRLWLDRKVRARQNDILRALPNALELMSVSVEAGLGFDVAMRRVADRYENDLSEELDQVLTETALGRPRAEALHAMGERVGIQELQNFANAVAQSQLFGTSISAILKVQAEEMRRRRYLQARERGARAPLRMLPPMLGCIFPTLWVVLLGPAVILLFTAFRLGR
jgi:tight adherence protein C